MSEQNGWQEPEEKHAVARLADGVKGALALFLASPFIVFLVILWPIYRWAEMKEGNPPPEPFWNPFLERYFPHRAYKKELPQLEPFEREQRRAAYREAALAAASTPQPVESHGFVLAPNAPQTEGAERVALVTGGSSQLGQAIVQALMEQNYRVALVCFESDATAMIQRYPMQEAKIQSFTCDLRNPEAIETLVGQVVRHFGQLDVVVHNAARFEPDHEENPSWQSLENLFKVNVMGPLWLSLKAAPWMRSGPAGGGHIIQIGDIWGERPLLGYSGYSSSKAALHMAGRSLARELAPEIRVNTIAPGAVFPQGEDDRAYQVLLSNTPLAAEAGPLGVITALNYLLATPFVTGQVLHVDGGRLLR
ncbi:SDR family NAD(P)-dependent oxidoreductase [Magnetococcus marinus]|uniref:SDR family NAD(P)-dependent oxidoreductase n=1 Tax=Magnetococcus marinus TaxID=1124597 RepID=UPI0002F9C867|nr:SDR family NAD(P)-dependent oxidoreductase [Magnetococcus marinus]